MKERLHLSKNARIAAAATVLALLVLLCVPWRESASSAPTLPETVLYQEDLEDGQAQGWKLESGWAIIQDTAGNRALRGQGHFWARHLDDAWEDYTLRLRVKLIRGGIHLNYRVSQCLRYFIGFNEQGLYLSKTSPCGTHSELRVVPQLHSLGRWYEVKITGSSGKIDVYVDGSLKLSYTDPDPLLYGTIALETLEDSEVYVDDIDVSGKPSPTLGLQWVRTGGPLGGLGYDIRMRPDNPDIMYVTEAWSGVHKSTDGGRTWQPRNEGITTRAGPSGDAIPVFSLTIDPHNPDIIWCGTQNKRGIFKSTDGGETWVEKDQGVIENQGISFRGFSVDPRDSRIVYAAAEISSFAWTPNGKQLLGRQFDVVKGVVYKTTDGGEHWSAIWRGNNVARYVWINPRSPDTVYVSTGIFDREAASKVGVGVLKSTDGGATWQALGSRNGLKNLYVGSLFMHPENPDILLAGAGNNADWQWSGIYLSEDGGGTWTQVRDLPFAIGSVEFALGDPRIAYAGGAQGVYRSIDGGRTWELAAGGPAYGPPGIRPGLPIDFQVDPRNPDRIFVNNYGGGNFLSEDGGQSWVAASQGYTGAQLRDIAVDPLDPNRVCTVGRSGPFRSTDGGATWEGLNYPSSNIREQLAEPYAVALDPRTPSRVLISDEGSGYIALSTDGGVRWELAYQNLQIPTRVAAMGAGINNAHGFKSIVFAPSDPSVVYAGSCRDQRSLDEGRIHGSYGVFKSRDRGQTWEAANDVNSGDQNVNVLAVDPLDPRVVYAGTVTSGVLKTTDGGGTWKAVNSGLRVLDIRALVIDPRDPQILYAGAENGGIARSTDGGAHWKQSSTGMDPQAVVRDIVIDPTNPQILYAADLRTGVYQSIDGAKTWVKINDGLRTRAVTALALSSDGKVLYAATEGEGVFRLDLASASGG